MTPWLAALRNAVVHLAFSLPTMIVVSTLMLTMPGSLADDAGGGGPIAKPRGVAAATVDGRHVYYASCDGWVSKYDTQHRSTVISLRVADGISELAVASDGSHLAVAGTLPPALVLLDGDLNLLRTHPLIAHDGRQGSHVSAIFPASPRQAFVAILHDLGEIWEISVDPDARDIPLGFIHDHRMREGTFVPGYLNPRRTVLRLPLPEIHFSDDYSLLRIAAADGGGQIVSLDARRAIADLPLVDHPFLGPEMHWTAPERSHRACE